MRIAHVVWSLSTGGIETMLVDIANEQVKSCEVRIYVINDYYDKCLLNSIDEKVKICLLNRKPGSGNVLSLLMLNLQLMIYRPSVIHCHQANLAKVIWVPFKKVLTIHNTHSNPICFGKYDKLFCISKAVKEHTALQGFPDGVLIYNGIHTEKIIPKRDFALSPGHVRRFVCIGRLHPDKGQWLIIEAFNILVNQHNQSGFTIDIIGDGEERPVLEKLTSQYGLNGFIHFLGRRPRSWIYPHLKDYDLFILPSISEGFGLTVAEACAAKVPVLTCDLPGPMEVIDGGRLGDRFKTGDAKSLADGIEKLMKSGEDIYRIESAYEYVKANFDVSKTANSYLREYE